MGKKVSGAQKRKKKREKEEAIKEAVEELERLKLGPTKLWTGIGGASQGCVCHACASEIE